MTAEKNQQKIIETKALLLEVIKNPQSFKDDASLVIALKTQTGLAKYYNENFNIDQCSLNTFKANSESLLDRGFIEINELRISAKDAIESSIVGSKPLKNTRTGLRHKVDALEIERDTLRKMNYLLSMIVNELRGELKQMAHSTAPTDQRQEKYKYVNKVVEAKLNYTLNGKL